MGAGAGYTINNYKSIGLNKVLNLDIDLSNIDLNDVDYSEYYGAYKLNTSININIECEGSLDELSAYDYYGNGTKLEFETPCVLHYEGPIEAVIDDPFILDDSYFDIDENGNGVITNLEKFKEDIAETFMDSVEYPQEYMYGRGYVHSTWDGTLFEDTLIYYDEEGHISAYLTNQKVIDAVDYCVVESGDTKIEYIDTYSNDYEPYETYEECKDAIIKEMKADGVDIENAEDYIKEREYYGIPTVINNDGDIEYDVEFVD